MIVGVMSSLLLELLGKFAPSSDTILCGRKLSGWTKILSYGSLICLSVGCYNRQEVENHEHSGSRLDLRGREEVILEHLGSQYDKKQEPPEGKTPIRLLVQAGLLDGLPAKDGEPFPPRAAALDRFQSFYGVDVDVTQVTEADLVDGQLTEELLGEHELILVPSYWLVSAKDQRRLLPLEEANIEGLKLILEDFVNIFSPIPPSVDLNYLLPYMRLSYGIYYNQAHLSTPPSTWEQCFLLLEDSRFWDAVYFLNDPEITLSIAAILVANLDESRQAKLATTTEELAARFRDLGSGFTLPAIDSLRTECVDWFSSKGERMNHVRLEMHQSVFKEHHADQDLGLHQYVRTLSEKELDLAVRLIQLALVFGADFRGNMENPVDSVLKKWAMIVSASGDLIPKDNHYADIHYVIPEEGSLILIDTFAIPAGLSEERLHHASKLLNFMLLKPVAASVTTYSSRASLIPGSSAFVPSELINSPIYTLPSRDRMHFLPFFSPELMSRKWEQITSFQQTLQSGMGVAQ